MSDEQSIDRYLEETRGQVARPAVNGESTMSSDCPEHGGLWPVKSACGYCAADLQAQLAEARRLLGHVADVLEGAAQKDPRPSGMLHLGRGFARGLAQTIRQALSKESKE